MGSAVPAFVGFSRFWPRKARLGGLFHGDPAEIRTPDTLLKRQVLCRLSYWVTWLGWQGSNLRMPESKSGALPLGYIPSKWTP